MIRLACRRWLAAVVWLALAGIAGAAGFDAAPEFPADVGNWVNSGPVSLSALKGKAALLWFYSGECPRCRKRWPELMALSQKFEGKPIVFIAVNSGNARGQVSEYALAVGCRWPILVDSTREFEKRVLDNEISLQNIWQAMIITPDGRMQNGNWTDLDATVERALVGAKWKVDPAKIPDSLRPAWMSVEFGNTPAAAPLVKKALTSKKQDVRAGAVVLQAAIQEEMDAQMAQARTALDQDHKWQAFQIYNSLAQAYKGFDLPDGLLETKKKLSEDAGVKKELLAMKNLDRIKHAMTGSRAPSRKMTVAGLEKIVHEQPNTTAAAEAKQLIAELTGNAGDLKSRGARAFALPPEPPESFAAMCRLLALHSTAPIGATRPLLDAPNSLAVQSRLDASGQSHVDGWGVAWFDETRQPRVDKSLGAAYDNARYGEIAHAVSATSLVAHVRQASVGNVSLANTHPFTHGRWIFAHNGTLQNFAERSDPMLAAIPDDLRRSIQGQTDSEHAFYYWLGQLRAAAGSLDGQIGFEAVLSTLAATVRQLYEWFPAHGGEESKFNFVATDGHLLGATRWRHRLSLLEQKGSGNRSVLIASEPTEGDGWGEVPDRSLVVVDEQMNVHASALS